jgi:hypothetical protein
VTHVRHPPPRETKLESGQGTPFRVRYPKRRSLPLLRVARLGSDASDLTKIVFLIIVFVALVTAPRDALQTTNRTLQSLAVVLLLRPAYDTGGFMVMLGAGNRAVRYLNSERVCYRGRYPNSFST